MLERWIFWFAVNISMAFSMYDTLKYEKIFCIKDYGVPLMANQERFLSFSQSLPFVSFFCLTCSTSIRFSRIIFHKIRDSIIAMSEMYKVTASFLLWIHFLRYSLESFSSFGILLCPFNAKFLKNLEYSIGSSYSGLLWNSESRIHCKMNCTLND